MIRRLLALLVALCVPCISPAQSQAAHPTGMAQIDVTANDYAFAPLPEAIKPGPTAFTFANHGKVQHELAIARLRHGVTLDDVLKGIKAGGRPRDFSERSVGILVAAPGQSPEGQLLVDLRQGETYLVYCNFRDTPEAPFHMMLGMYTTFQPR